MLCLWSWGLCVFQCVCMCVCTGMHVHCDMYIHACILSEISDSDTQISKAQSPKSEDRSQSTIFLLKLCGAGRAPGAEAAACSGPGLPDAGGGVVSGVRCGCAPRRGARARLLRAQKCRDFAAHDTRGGAAGSRAEKTKPGGKARGQDACSRGGRSWVPQQKQVQAQTRRFRKRKRVQSLKVTTRVPPCDDDPAMSLPVSPCLLCLTYT